MPTFTVGKGDDRKVVTLKVEGPWLRVTKERADGTTKLEVKEFASEADARSACAEAARQLRSHGYKEPGRQGKPDRQASPRPAATAPKEVAPRKTTRGLVLDLLAEAGEGEAEAAEPSLPRMALAPEARPGMKPARKKKAKKRKAAKPADALDKRVIAAIAAFGMLCVGVVGFLGYEAFLKPASIVGHWEGSRTEHEIGKYLTNTQYRLVLDDQKNASMTVAEGTPSGGTYAVRGDRLVLTLKGEKDEDGREGEPAEVQYRIKLGGATLDLFDPASGKKVVQLIRFHDSAVARVKPPAAAPKEIAGAPADKGADDRLASVPFGAKDGAFQLRHPEGWQAETGGRADNSYSWAKLAKGSARVRVYADVAGSLLAGPNSSDHEEGSEAAPVHAAHLRYKKDASELYTNYEESQPATFKGSAIGEGRISTFTATEGAVFGTKLRGIRVTLLTNDRRVSVLCDAPTKSFESLLPTFLATCRSLSR